MYWLFKSLGSSWSHHSKPRIQNRRRGSRSGFSNPKSQQKIRSRDLSCSAAECIDWSACNWVPHHHTVLNWERQWEEACSIEIVQILASIMKITTRECSRDLLGTRCLDWLHFRSFIVKPLQTGAKRQRRQKPKVVLILVQSCEAPITKISRLEGALSFPCFKLFWCWVWWVIRVWGLLQDTAPGKERYNEEEGSINALCCSGFNQKSHDLNLFPWSLALNCSALGAMIGPSLGPSSSHRLIYEEQKRNKMVAARLFRFWLQIREEPKTKHQG